MIQIFNELQTETTKLVVIGRKYNLSNLRIIEVIK